MVKKKSDKQAYLEQFSKLVRWRLPTGEAYDVIADYAELIAARSEDGESLLKSLGSPFSAAMRLKPSGEYWRWMTVFVFLGLCSVYFFCGLFCGWRDHEIFNAVLFYLSAGLAVFWKGTLPKKEDRQSCRGLIPAVIGMFSLSAASSLFAWNLMWSREIPGEQAVAIFRSCICMTGIVSVITSLTGLVFCRIRHRRWLALTMAGFSSLFICLLWMVLSTGLNGAGEILPWTQKNIIPPFVIGTAGVIWSLC